MSAGWDLKEGEIKYSAISDDKLWSLFNFVFSSACHKTNSYKFGLIKSILDNLFNAIPQGNLLFLSYENIFEKFAENYWNLVVKYGIRQMKFNGQSGISKIEQILLGAVKNNVVLANVEFSSIDNSEKLSIIKKVTSECKKYVIGALYQDFDGALYAFDLKADGILISLKAYDFMLKYKAEIEGLNYYHWAKFLESVNDDNQLVRVIDKLELATPRRNDLSVYREILRNEFEICNCFYCGKKLSTIHVDHFIPWTFTKEDKIWNFVLACPHCNEVKNNRVPAFQFIKNLELQNRLVRESQNAVVKRDFELYNDELLCKMWDYAKMSGIRVFS